MIQRGRQRYHGAGCPPAARKVPNTTTNPPVNHLATVRLLAAAYGFDEAEALSLLLREAGTAGAEQTPHVFEHPALPDSESKRADERPPFKRTGPGRQPPQPPDATTAPPASSGSRSSSDAARTRWHHAVQRIREKVDSGDAVMLHASSAFGKLPQMLFPQTLVMRPCCCPCVSPRTRHRACIEHGRPSFLLSAATLFCWVLCCAIIMLEAIDVLPWWMADFVSWPLATPVVIQWVCLFDDAILRLILKSKLVWMYLVTVAAWTGIGFHLLPESPLAVLFAGTTPLMNTVFLDAIRPDATYFRYALLGAYASGGAVLLQKWLMIIMGVLPFKASPFVYTVNMSGLVPARSPIDDAGTTSPIIGNNASASIPTIISAPAAVDVFVFGEQVVVFSEIGVFQSLTWTLMLLVLRIFSIYVVRFRHPPNTPNMHIAIHHRHPVIHSPELD